VSEGGGCLSRRCIPFVFNWTVATTPAHGRNALSFSFDKYREDAGKPGTFVLPRHPQARNGAGVVDIASTKKKGSHEASQMIAFAAIPQRNHGRSLRRFRQEAREEIDGSLTRS
jgi:hypothetical protein